MRKIFTLPMLVAILCIGIIFVYTNSDTDTSAVTTTSTHEVETANQRTKGIFKAMKYQHTLRANQETNKIDLKDVLKARKLADNRANEKAGEVKWEFMGPNDVGGRTRTLLIDRNNPKKLYTGGVAGGIFTSENGGLSWTSHPQNASLNNIAVSTMAQAANGDIYVGTGEPFYFLAGQGSGGVAGTGIYKSSDNGVSFQLLEATIPQANSNTDTWAAVARLATHPTNSNIIYAAAAHSTNGGNYTGGAFISTDAGATWNRPEGVTGGVAYDVKVGSNGIVHFAVGTGYFRSDAAGTTFTDLSGDQPGQYPKVSGRKVIAISASNPDYVYVVSVENGCLREVLQSSNAGSTWVRVGQGGSLAFQPMSNSVQCQGDYDLALAVDSANPERIFLAGISLWSWSATRGWKQVDNLFEDPTNVYYVHADKHDIIFDNNDPNKMYVVSDGGVSLSRNAQSEAPTFSPLNKNYGVTQFYSVAATIDGRVVGGTQDNGTQFVSFGGSSRLAAVELQGGDGGRMEVSKLSPKGVFAANPNGVLWRSSNGGDSFSSYLDEFIDCLPVDTEGNCNSDGEMDGNPGFVTEFHLWENLNYLDFNGGGGTIDPDLIPEGTTLARMFAGNNDGELWMTDEPLDYSKVPNWYNGIDKKEDATQGTGFIARSTRGGITCMTTTRDGDAVYAGTSSGSILRVTGLNTKNPENYLVAELLIEGGGGRFVSSVSIDKNIPTNLLVSLGNYGNDDYVYLSKNATSNDVVFNLIQGEGDTALPPMPVYSAIIDQDNGSRIIAGTELGIWVATEIQTGPDTFEYTWAEENDEMGRVPVFSVKQEPIKIGGCNVLYIGTHGRGIYRSTSYSLSFCDVALPGFDVTDVTTPELALENVQLFPNPMTNNATLQVDLTEAATINLSIFDAKGSLVRTENLGQKSIGTQSITINRNNMLSGNYFVSLQMGNGATLTRQLMVK